MSRRPLRLAIASALFLGVCAASPALERTAALPLVFQRNEGQLSAGVLFAGSTQQYSLELRAEGMRFTLPQGRVLTLGFAHGLNPRARPLAEAPFRTNLYLGNDPAQWRTGLRNYNRVALDHLYPGVDGQFYARGSEIEHDFIVAPRADAGQVALTLSGADSTQLTGEGDLLLKTADGALRLHKPVAYQLTAGGTHEPVAARFVLAANKRQLRFALGAYDHTRTLVIDPVITYATYLAGASGSTPTAIASDSSGNVYIAGYTASTLASYAAAATTSSPTGLAPTTSKYATFIAQLASTASGSQIAWVSYYGSTQATVQANALALQPGGSTLYIGGQTTATNLPGTGSSYTTFDHAPTANGSTFGFLASFATSTGAFNATTYVEGTHGSSTAGQTAITALAVDASGNVTAAGQSNGSAFPVTSTAFAVHSAVISNTSLQKGVILRLDPTLTTEAYGTYLAGDQSGSTASTSITAVALDSGGTNIYLAGNTAGDFPRAGAYSTGAVNTPPAGKTGTDAFACEIVPSTATLPYVFWSGGSLNDAASALALDASNNLYLVGQTTSTNFVANGSTTVTNSGSTNSPTTPLQSTYPTAALDAGFLVKLDSTGKLITSTYLSGPATTTASATAVNTDAAGNVYVAGASNAVKASFPQAASGSLTGVPALPAAEDLSPDSSTGSLTQRAYLLELPPALTSVTYRAYAGPASGTASAVGVALDGSANAYLLTADTPASGGPDFTTGSAAQPYAQLANSAATSAYVAQIAFTSPASTASLTAATPTYTPARVGYLSTTNLSTLVLTWSITGAASGANSVVFNLPYSQYLKAYALTAVTLNGSALPAGTCTLGATSVANTRPGLTCILPTLAAGATDTFVLTTPVTAAVATAAASASTISIPAQAFDAQGDSLNLAQTVSIGLVPTLTVTDSVSAAPNPPGNFYFANSTTDTTTPNTTVVYTVKVTNTSANDSPNTKLNLNLASTYAFTPTSVVSSSSPNCDPTTATNGCDVPANSSVTYTITGVYVIPSTQSSAGPFTLSNAAPTLTYTPTTNAAAPKGTTTTLSVGVYAQPQTITFAPASPVNYGVAPITLNGTASSGLPVSYSLSANSPATLNNQTGVLTVTGVGTITIYANQYGQYNYAKAPQVTATIVVNQETQTITFPQPASPVQYGAAPITVSATASSGLTVTFTLGAGSPATISGNTITITGGGTIVVNANQPGTKNIAAAPTVSQSIVVTAAPQTITFPAPPSPVMYGAPSITLAATSSSGLAVTYSLVPGSPAMLSGNMVTVTGVGTVTINADQAGNSSYQAATTVQQSIVVNQAAQTINFTAVPSPLTYPASPVMLSTTSSSGLPVTLTLSPGSPSSLSGNTLTFNGVGTSIVTATQGGNANYQAAPAIAQYIVVNKATPTLTWMGSTIPYGTTLAGVLNATASVPGSFAYSYGSSAVLPSTVLPAGTYPLTVVFTPSDSTDYATTSTSATVIVTKVPVAVTLVSSANPAVSQSTVTFTAGVPVVATGSVLFYDGTNQIGSGYITAGIAAFSTSALSVGPHAITAVYGGDVNYSGGTSPALNEVITDYGIVTGSGSNSITTATVHRGQTASYTIVVSPSGTAFAAPVTFTITGLPTGATATFTPSTIAAGAGSTSIAIAVAVPANLAKLDRPTRPRTRETAPIALALLLLPLWMQRRKTRRLVQALLASLLLAITATTLTGCAGSSPAPETYTMTVTASSSGLVRTTTLFLIVD